MSEKKKTGEKSKQSATRQKSEKYKIREVKK